IVVGAVELEGAIVMLFVVSVTERTAVATGCRVSSGSRCFPTLTSAKRLRHTVVAAGRIRSASPHGSGRRSRSAIHYHVNRTSIWLPDRDLSVGTPPRVQRAQQRLEDPGLVPITDQLPRVGVEAGGEVCAERDCQPRVGLE